VAPTKYQRVNTNPIAIVINIKMRNILPFRLGTKNTSNAPRTGGNVNPISLLRHERTPQQKEEM
jgi:hypothetical protein